MAKTKDPNEIIHLQVKPGGQAVYKDKAYGDRATLQVVRGDRGAVDGPVEEVDPDKVPDVGDLPTAA